MLWMSAICFALFSLIITIIGTECGQNVQVDILYSCAYLECVHVTVFMLMYMYVCVHVHVCVCIHYRLLNYLQSPFD